MSVSLCPSLGIFYQGFTNGGLPNNIGYIYTYIAGGTTPQATFTTSAGNVENDNPITLDASGRTPSEVWLTDGVAYRMDLYDVNANPIKTFDNIYGIQQPVSGSGGSAMVGFIAAGTGAAVQTVQSKLRQVVSITDFYANGSSGALVDNTGAVDSYLGINCALATTARMVWGAPGTFTCGGQVTITHNNTAFVGAGEMATNIVAKANTTTQYLIYANGLSSVQITGMTVDANQANRSGVLTTTAYCINLNSCTETLVEDVTVQNSLGDASPLTSGVGCCIGGTSDRAIISNCRALNCGITGKISDGFFTSASNSLIIGCEADGCTDTAFAMESCSNTWVVGSTCNNCGSGLGISNAINTDTYGCGATGLTIRNWYATVSGGIFVGHPLLTSTGVLRDVSISDIIMHTDLGVYPTAGPAVNVTRTGTPKATNVTFNNVNIDTAGTHGFLIEGDDITLTACKVKNTVNSCVTVQGASTEVWISGGCKFKGAASSVIATGTSVVYVSGNLFISPSAFGFNVLGAAVVTDNWNIIVTPGTAYYNTVALSGTANAAASTTNTTLTDTRLAMTTNAYAGDVLTSNGKTMTVTSNTATVFTGSGWSGGGNPGNGQAWTLDATLYRNGITNGTLMIKNFVGSAPAGALNNMFPIVDAQGNAVGYVPTYAS